MKGCLLRHPRDTHAVTTSSCHQDSCFQPGLSPPYRDPKPGSKSAREPGGCWSAARCGSGMAFRQQMRSGSASAWTSTMTHVTKRSRLVVDTSHTALGVGTSTRTPAAIYVATISNLNIADWFIGHPRPIRLNIADWFIGHPRPVRLNVGPSVDQIHDAVLTRRAQASVRKVRCSRATAPWSLQLASGHQHHFAGVGDDLARRLQVVGADPDAALS